MVPLVIHTKDQLSTKATMGKVAGASNKDGHSTKAATCRMGNHSNLSCRMTTISNPFVGKERGTLATAATLQRVDPTSKVASRQYLRREMKGICPTQCMANKLAEWNEALGDSHGHGTLGRTGLSNVFKGVIGANGPSEKCCN